MAYTPPGVYTEVEIANNIVQLPGGTRILSFIGTGRDYKTVAGEAVQQPIVRATGVQNTPVRSVTGVYDFTNPGGGIKNYPASGATTNTYYGSGWTLDAAGDIAWSPAANSYPSSTTPQIGDTYYSSFDYSGTTLTGTTLISDAAVGTVLFSGAQTDNAVGSALSLDTIDGQPIAIYSGNDTGDYAFPASGVGLSGMGFFLSGSNIAWTKGTTADFAEAIAGSGVPISGANYYVHYNYTGTLTESFVQTSAYSNGFALTSTLSSGATFVNPITGTSNITVSGLTSVYPFSGLATGTDASGYGKDGSGWMVSGTTAGSQGLAWGAVDPSAYGYPAATVAPISGIFFADYTYYKGADDYDPANYTDYNEVVNDYGPDAEWTQVTTGPNAGSWTFRNLNPLTLAARIAFANGASLINLTQMSGLGITNGSFSTALDKLQSKIIDVIVPLTVGSGATIGEIPLATKSTIFQTTKTHCDTMALPQNKKERVAIVSYGQAEIGDSSTENTYVFEGGALQDKRMTLLAPGLTTVEIQDPDGTFQNIQVEAPFLAAAMGALSCNPTFDVATPLTNKSITSFLGISARTTDHTSVDYLESEKNILAAAGITVIDRNGSNVFVRHQLTTDQTNVANGEFSVVTTTDYVSQAVRFTTEQFIGKKLVNSIIVPAVKSTILATMAQLSAVQIINSTGAITVTVNPQNPTEILATVQYVPVFPLNRIRVTFTIRTQL